MDHKTQSLLKFKVYDMDSGRLLSRHTKYCYAQKSRTKMVEVHGFKRENLRIVLLARGHARYRYLSMAREKLRIFGF